MIQSSKNIFLPLIGFPLLFVLICLISCTHGSDKDIQALNTLIGNVQAEFAPDNREAIFEVEVKKQADNYILKGETNLAEAKASLLNNKLAVSIIDSINVLPQAGKKHWGLTILPVSNLRGKPQYSAELVSQALIGTPILILKQIDSWSLIQTPDQYISWILTSSVNMMDDDDFQTWKNQDRIFMNQDLVPVVQKPDNNSRLLASLFRGSLLVAKNEIGKYIEIELPDGTSGFVEKNFTLGFEEWSNRNYIDFQQVEKLAKSLLGRSYMWGGTSPAAMDCSGFIKTLHWSQGIILARDASLQVLHGKTIEIDSTYSRLQAGDLLFFGTKASDGDPERVTHVGFYLGNQEFIHASEKVKISSFDPESNRYSESRRKSLLHAKRIQGQLNTRGIQSVKNHPWYK